MFANKFIAILFLLNSIIVTSQTIPDLFKNKLNHSISSMIKEEKSHTGTLQQTSTYKYNSEGYRVKQTGITHERGNLSRKTWNSTITYDLENKKIIKKNIQNETNRDQIIYKYDTKGLITEIIYSKTRTLISYNSNNKVQSRKTYNIITEKLTNMSTYDYKKNGNYTVSYFKKDSLTGFTDYRENEKGLLVYTKYNLSYMKSTINKEYDNNGNLILETTEYEDGKPSREYKYSYDEFGNMISEKRYYPNNELYVSFSKEYTYNDKNLWTKKVSYRNGTKERITTRNFTFF